MGGEIDEEAEPTISIQEYLNEVEEQELEADMVLGGDEGKECTYANGYLKRQAIFSCLTCTPDGNSGVCTACSLSCHDGHEIVELWTKRNFKCDCGNSKFGEVFCKLYANKDVENVENSYNHNFKGEYCTCGRPYPDPDLEDQVEMIQCCVCEDWFHEEHIGSPSSDEIPRDDEGEPLYEDFICQECSRTCLFLASYPPSIMAAKNSTLSKEKNVLGEATSITEFENLESIRRSPDASLGVDCPDIPNGKIFCNGESSTRDLGSSEIKEEMIIQSSRCILGTNPDLENPVICPKPLFLGKNWRDILCRCQRCMDMYTQKNVSYLLDKDDSIMEYEKMAKQKREEKLQQQENTERSLLDRLGHVEKIEILSGIADMKDEIRSFLESFDSSKPITSEDIHQVFENLAKKRRRVQ